MKTFLKWITKKEFSAMTIVGGGLVAGICAETGSLLAGFGALVVWAILTAVVETIAHD